MILKTIRTEIARREKQGLTRYRIAKDTGLEQSQLSRFVSGERGLSCEAAEVLLDYFGYALVKADRG